MADETGSKDRATVALIAEKVEGLKELTRSGFTDVQRQLDRLEQLPQKVTELAGTVEDQATRIVELERARIADTGKLDRLVSEHETGKAVQKAQADQLRETKERQVSSRGFYLSTAGVCLTMIGVACSVLVAVGVL